MSLNIVLVEPEIPQNTGNIVRTCAATGINLHLIEPLGFSIEDKYLKRAGLDYWNLVNITTYSSLDNFIETVKPEDCFFVTTKGEKSYSEVKFSSSTYLFFGKETKGLPESLLQENYNRCIRIPMITESRSLNLSNSVAIITYEALRQLDFPELEQKGKLTSF
jgi:tRNA (cytidine/uridine-2'-O-)-methyltransferase